MLKAILIAAVLAAASASVASAQDMRAQYPSGNGYGANGYSGGSDGGLGRYCPPGYSPQSFPSGNGIRCVAEDGRAIYGAPF